MAIMLRWCRLEEWAIGDIQSPKISLDEIFQYLKSADKPCLTSGEFIKKYHLTSASAVQRSMSALLDKDIVTSSNGQYYIYDYFLYYWLNQK